VDDPVGAQSAPDRNDFGGDARKTIRGNAMKRLITLAGAAVALVAGTAPAQAQDKACDRACLGGMLTRFLDAVAQHNPAGAPIAIGFRQTENSRVTLPGDGIWRSFTGYGAVQRRYFDPVTGNAAFFGLVREGDKFAIASLRIRVEHRQVSEAEWTIARASDPGITGEPGKAPFSTDTLAQKPPPDRVVPPAQRLPRDRLVAIVNSYFDGITADNGKLVQANPGCMRLENGVEVTGRPLPAGRENDGYQGRSDCTSGYSGLGIAFAAGRRYPLVDEVQQVVLGSAVFIRQPGNAKRRNHFMEYFTIDHGKISTVHASMMYADPTLPLPNWPPYEMNLPLAPEGHAAQ
jgi:hypothetical protein